MKREPVEMRHITSILTPEGLDAIVDAVVHRLREEGLVWAGVRYTEKLNTNIIRTVPETGFMRQSEVLKLIPIGATTWWDWVKSGKAPASVKLSKRVTAWRAEDIRELIERLKAGSA